MSRLSIAASIGSYKLPEFVELGICQIRACLGHDTPILVVDDRSEQTHRIIEICQKHGVQLVESRVQRGHFAGDMTNTVNAITWARAHECEVAVKLSQRFVFRLPVCRSVIESVFADGLVHFASPGKMSINTLRRGGSPTFAAMPALTDIMLFRAAAVDPQILIDTYRDKCQREKGLPWGQWVEATACDWHDVTFAGHSRKVEEFTNHQPGQEHIYLRRNQDDSGSYRDLARPYGICGEFRLDEWRMLERGMYDPRPMII